MDGFSSPDPWDSDAFDECLFCTHEWHGVQCVDCVCRSSFEPVAEPLVFEVEGEDGTIFSRQLAFQAEERMRMQINRPSGEITITDPS